MREHIAITIDQGRLDVNDENKERLCSARAFKAVDRVPVVVNTNQWLMLAARKVTFGQYIRTPKDNLREQILNVKWRLEMIHDDLPLPDGSLKISPDLGCIRGTAFDIPVTFSENHAPKSKHILEKIEQIDELAVPDAAGGFNERLIEYYHGMQACREDFDVRLNGKPLELGITIGYPGGPMPSAFALAGQNLFLWMIEDPVRVHRLMDVVTQSHLRCVRYFDDLVGRDHDHSIGLGADTIELISAGMFKEFVVPYYNHIYEAYPGPRGIHNCGQNEHLLESIRDDLKINSHNGFGFCVNRERLAETMSGRVVLQGGPSPMLLASGDRGEILSETERYIEALAPGGGFILGLGGGSVAGTPPRNFDYLLEAARRVACGAGRS